MVPQVRKTQFVPEWIDINPRIPVPKVEWIKDKKLDVAYGCDPLQRYDMYYPSGKKDKYPVLILVHGGGFTHCDKRDLHLYPGFYALQAGFVLVSVNYRLAPAASFPAAVEDLKTVVAALRQNADNQQLDANNFFLYGASAGGNLVSYVGLDGPASHGTERDYHVSSVAALCGLVSFNTYFDQMPWALRLVPSVRTMMKGYVGAMPYRDTGKAWTASADSRITTQAPPFYIQHGNKDSSVNVQQSVDFYNKLKAQSGLAPEDLILDILEGVGHAGTGPDFLEFTNVKPILDFFERHIAEPED